MDYSFLAARLSFTFIYTCIFFSWQINSAAAGTACSRNSRNFLSLSEKKSKPTSQTTMLEVSDRVLVKYSKLVDACAVHAFLAYDCTCQCIIVEHVNPILRSPL